MHIVIVPKNDIDVVFPKVKDYLDKAIRLSGGRYTLEEVKDNIDFRNHQLWIAFKDNDIYASAVTEFIEYPTGLKSLVGHFIGGKDLEEWKQPIVDSMAQFGKLNGCNRIEFMGRRGWGKPLKKIGWKETYRTYEYSLEN